MRACSHVRACSAAMIDAISHADMRACLQRNDSTFFGWVALAFLGPAAIILGIAAATGYLDTLYANSITIR